MNRIKDALERRRQRRAKLPWRDLEAEAARQGVSPADIFFDRAGRPSPPSPALPTDQRPAPASKQRTRPSITHHVVINPRSRRV